MNAFQIVVRFLIFGVLWILVSDHLLNYLVQDTAVTQQMQSFKGIVFVALSALLIYVLEIRNEHAETRRKNDAIREKDRLAQILNVSPAVIYSLLEEAPHTQRFKVDFVGDNVLRVTGFAPKEWLDPTFWRCKVHPDDLFKVDAAQLELTNKHSAVHEYRFLHQDGRYRWINDRMVLLRDEATQSARIIGSWLDVTEQREAQAQTALVAHVFETSQEGIFITDAAGRFVSVNQTFTTVTGYTMDDLAGKTPKVLQSGRQDAAFYKAMWEQITSAGRWEGEVWNRRRTGEVYPEWLIVSTIRDAEGKAVQYLGIFTETSSHKAAEERIQRLANYDSLTGLPNRALLNDRAQLAIHAAVVSQVSMAVMHVNVDRFAHINESFGHQVGDQLLVEMAKRLASNLKPEETVSRIGGDDFVLLLPKTRANSVAQLAIQIMDSLGEPFVVEDQTLRITASIGIAEFPENGSNFLQLTQAAESAVHEAKRAGRNTVHFFSRDTQERIKAALALEQELRLAVGRDQLVLHYQPQIDVQSGRIIGCEALVRWNHPQRGMIAPAQFIPVAEESGLIDAIGHWVLLTAARQNAQWQQQGLPAVPVAVNLSVIQFRNPGLRDSVLQILQSTALPPALLELELTESVAMEDSGFTVDKVASLKALGVALSIDDFGTGYSSLSYLKRFQIDKLKIDQSFVQGLTMNHQDEAIVNTIIALAHSLGLRTIAEGVETSAQLDFLKASGCDEFQGYLYSRPVPAQAFEAMLRGQMSPAA